MNPLRFCMITTFYPPYGFGGDAVFVQRLSNALARRGHEVDVIHCIDSYRGLAKGPVPPADPTAPGVTTHGLVSGVGIVSPLATHLTGYPLFKARRIRQILDAKPFDVTHFHNISLVGGPMVLRHGRGVRLYTMHEHWLICPTHVLFRFNREPCVKRSCLRCSLVYRRPPQLWRYTGMLERALRHVDAFIAPSEFTRKRHRADGLDIPAVHIPHFVPAEESGEPVGSGDVRLPDRPFFLVAGRLEKVKGIHTLIPVFREWGAADLVIAGDGDDAANLRRLAAGSARIHFLGRLAPSALRVLYGQAIAVVVPSLTFEIFGLVIVEAYAARTPVIVRDLGALPDLVAESGGGFAYRDTAGLLAALERLRADKALRDRLGEAGHAAYRRRWTEEAHLERYLDLIETIQSRKHAAALAS